MGLGILVVDDDRNERQGICFLLKSHYDGVQLREAANGEAALEVLRTEPVDIVVTDIKMPLMDGIELGQQARKLWPNLRIMILSAYGDFQYAQKAIRFDVDSYLLKPIVPADFIVSMDQIIQQCQLHRKRHAEQERLHQNYDYALGYAKEKLLMDLIGSAVIPRGTREAMAAMSLSICAPETRLVLMGVDSSFFQTNTGLLRKQVHRLFGEENHMLLLNERQCLLFVNRPGLCDASQRNLPQAIQQLDAMLAQAVPEGYHILVGEALLSLEDIYPAFQRLEARLETRSFASEHGVMYIENTRDQGRSDSIERILRKIDTETDQADAQSALRHILAKLDTMDLSKKHSAVIVKYTFCEIAKKVLMKSGTCYPEMVDDYVERIFQCQNLADIREIFTGLSQEIFHGDAKGYTQQQESEGRAVTRLVKDIIDKNYMQDLSLDVLAGQVFLTPSYLSFLFKKEVGISFIQYLTRYRLEKSKELLSSTNIRILDIGEQIGYSNPSYFSMLFKNYYGISPAKFRETHRRKDLE